MRIFTDINVSKERETYQADRILQACFLRKFVDYQNLWSDQSDRSAPRKLRGLFDEAAAIDADVSRGESRTLSKGFDTAALDINVMIFLFRKAAQTILFPVWIARNRRFGGKKALFRPGGKQNPGKNQPRKLATELLKKLPG